MNAGIWRITFTRFNFNYETYNDLIIPNRLLKCTKTLKTMYLLQDSI